MLKIGTERMGARDNHPLEVRKVTFFRFFSYAVADRCWVFLRVNIPFVGKCGLQLGGRSRCQCAAMHDCMHVHVFLFVCLGV